MTELRKRAHFWISTRLVLETLVVCASLGAAGAWLRTRPDLEVWAWPVALLQGLWFQRLYGVGHEVAHRKLFPEQRRLNDLAGQLVLLPIAVPVRIFRKIHQFHHGQNRRDHHTAALDTFVIRKDTPLRRAGCHLLWYLAVFGGGFFLHSLISIVLFLALPLSLARKVSPAFRGWSRQDRRRSWLAFATAVAGHLMVAWAFGPEAWAFALGIPLLAFAFVYSAILYVYHYDTPYGPEVRTHVRSLRARPFVARWLLHLNEHVVHHGAPAIPWYELPETAARWAEGGARPRDDGTLIEGVLRQLAGPRIIVEPRR